MLEKKEMTAQELQDLQKELQLRKENRKALADLLKAARMRGDLAKNQEYDLIRGGLMEMNETFIAEIEKTLKEAQAGEQ